MVALTGGLINVLQGWSAYPPCWRPARSKACAVLHVAAQRWPATKAIACRLVEQHLGRPHGNHMDHFFAAHDPDVKLPCARPTRFPTRPVLKVR